MIDEENEGNDDFTELRRLNAVAPANTLSRLRRRLGILQLGRDLVMRQAFAFWMVLDAFLRIFLVRPARDGRKIENAASGPDATCAGGHSREEKIR
ncbi:MAG: hypothetical protein ACKVX9_22385 [Blastocatellia bacterium]